MADSFEYFGAAPRVVQDYESRPEYTAVAGQVSFPVTYKVGFLDVYVNGSLQGNSDFTATDGVSVTLVRPSTAGDLVRFTARKQISVANTYNIADANSNANSFGGTATGTGDAAILGTVLTAGWSQTDGREVRVRWPAANTTNAPTINVNGSGAVVVTSAGGHPLPAGAFTAQQEVTLRYNSTGNRWEAITLSDTGFDRNHSLTNLLHPHMEGRWRDIYRAGWKPANFNQQWGGPSWGAQQTDAITGNTYNFEVATGNIEDQYQGVTFSQSSGATFYAQGFRLGDTVTTNAIWVKLRKVGGRVDNVTGYLFADDGSGTRPVTGSTPIAGGTSNSVLPGVAVNPRFNDWYRFTFPAPVTLNAGTKYWFGLRSASAANSGTYYIWGANQTLRSPHSGIAYGDGSTAWTAQSAYTLCFMVEQASGQLLQDNGQFSGKIVPVDGLYPMQSKGLTQPMRNFFDGRQFTAIIRGNSFAKGKPLADFTLGSDANRILLTTDATSGYVKVNVWKADRTLLTVAATAVDVSTTTHSDIAISIRSIGDGADYIQLWINGVLAGSLSNQTITFSTLFRESGTAWVGGGLAIPPTWTLDLNTSILPSASGNWTYNSTGEQEANVVSISNNRLIWNTNGYSSSTGTSYYARPTAGFNNATGWMVEWTGRIVSSDNWDNKSPMGIFVLDGTKQMLLWVNQKYLLSSQDGVTLHHFFQCDCATRDVTIQIYGKGSDYYVYYNGQLAIDGTGKLTGTTAVNQLQFGDLSTVSGTNGDTSTSALRYYTGGINMPQFSTGANIAEFAHWSGNRTEILPLLYGAGTPISVKNFSGLANNYVREVDWSEERIGILGTWASTSSSDTTMQDMEMYVFGDSFLTSGFTQATNSTGGTNQTVCMYIDGLAYVTPGRYDTPGVNYVGTISDWITYRGNVGLHKIEYRMSVSAGTGYAYARGRALTVKSTK